MSDFTELTGAYTGSATIRSALTIDDQNFFTSGSTSGIQYVTGGSTGAPTPVSASFGTVRALTDYQGQLYTDATVVGTSPAPSLAGVGTVGTGLPDVPNGNDYQAETELPGFPTTTDGATPAQAPSPYQFVFSNANTIYVADDRTDGFGGIQKWTLSSGTWTEQYSSQILSGSTTLGLRGLIEDPSTGFLYGTTTASSTASTATDSIVKMVDTGSAFTLTTLATSPTSTQFRGIALAPTTGTPTSLSLSSSPNPALPTASFTLTATVNHTALATDTVSFYDNGAFLGSGTTSQVGDTAATFTVDSGTIPAGGNYITAVFNGDTTLDASGANGPAFTTFDNAQFTYGLQGSFSFQATASDSIGGITNYALSGAPSWVAISGAGQITITGTPTAVTQTTAYNFTISANDANGNYGSQGFTLYEVPQATAAVPLTPGDLLVYRESTGGTTFGQYGNSTGSGGTTTTSVAAGVYLDEYTTAGVFVETVYMPAGSNVVSTLSGTTEGQMTLSADDNLIAFPAYNDPVGSSSPASATSAVAPRIIGTVNGNGVVNSLSNSNSFTTLINTYSTSTFRGAATVNGAEYWGAGSTAGIEYAGIEGGANATTTEVNSTSNMRTVGIYDGVLDWDTGTTAGVLQGIFDEVVFGTTTPINLPTGTLLTGNPQFQDNVVGQDSPPITSPYGFTIVNTDGGTTLDSSSLLYIVDDGSGTYRFNYNPTLNGGEFDFHTVTKIANNVLDIRSLTATVSGGNVILYGDEAANSSGTLTSFNTSIDTLTDVGGDSVGDSWTPLIGFSDPGSLASPVIQFRGIDFVPQVVGSTSPSLQITGISANPAPTANNTVLRSEAVTVNTTLLPATGWVSFESNGATLATVPISGNAASFTIPANALPVGADPIEVFYGGNSTYGPSTQSITLNVIGYTSSTTVVGNPVAHGVGTNVTLTASITFSQNAGTPNGSVTFLDNQLTLGTVSSITLVNSTLYTASLVVPTFATQESGAITPGIHGITAEYSGNSIYEASSGTTTQAVNANTFGAGDLLVVRVGDGTTPLTTTSGGNTIYVDEYNTTVNQTSPIQSICFPDVDNGTTHALIADSQQTPTDQISLSGNGQDVFITGYDAPPTETLASLQNSSAVTFPRTIGRISYTGEVDSGVALDDVANSGLVTGVYSYDGNSFYVTGSSGEVHYVGGYTATAGSQSSTQIDTGINGANQDLDELGVFSDQLYVSNESGGSKSIQAVGSGLPTTSGQNLTTLPLTGIPAGDVDSAVGFYMTQLNPASTGPDTLYIADDGAGAFTSGTLTKFTLNPSTNTWAYSGEIDATGNGTTLPAFNFLTGVTNGSQVTLYATYGNGGNANHGPGYLYSIADTTGYNSTFSSAQFSNTLTLNFVASVPSGTNEVFRGVAFVPTAPLSASTFNIVSPGSVSAGIPFSYTVAALSSSGNFMPTYNGTVMFTTTNGNAVLPTPVTLTSGIGTFSATLKAIGNSTITVTDMSQSAITDTSGTINVNPGPTNHFAISAPSTALGGTVFTFTVTAQDAYYNITTAYTGQVQFFSSDSTATLSDSNTLSNGIGTFSATLSTSGNQSIFAYDSVSSGITGITAPISVSNAATHFVVAAPPTATAGTAIVVTVTALDDSNVTATGYTGTVRFTSSDSQGGLAANVTLTNGVGFFAATLRTALPQKITAADTLTPSISGVTASINVSGIAANHFVVFAALLPTYAGVPSAYPGVPAAATSFATTGSPLVFSVLAEDPFNNLNPTYAGTVTFTTTDSGVTAGSLPANATLSGGIGTFSATLATAGNQVISVSDNTTASINGNTAPIVTRALVVTSFAVTPTGFTVSFSKSFKPSTVNLYTTGTVPDDVLVLTTGAVVSVRGSLLFNSTDTQLTFVKTATTGATGNFTPTNGLLAAGKYTVTLRSFNGSSGFEDSLGSLLDGTDTVQPGTNFQITFSVAPPPVAVGVPDFARGPSNTDAIFFSPSVSNGSTFALTYTNLNTSSTGTATVTFSTIGATLQANIQTALNGLAQVGSTTGTPNTVVVATNDLTTGANVLVTFQNTLATATSALLTTTTSGISIGQATVNLPNSQPGNGIPIALSNGTAVTSGTFVLNYNPAYLNITGVVSKLTASGATFSVVSNTGGVLTLSLSSPGAISATTTPITLGSLIATVPLSATASYGAKQQLHFTSEQLNGGSIPVTNVDGIQVVAYLGDVTDKGGAFTLTDAGAIAQVSGQVTNTNLSTIPGFTAFANLDPVIIGDVSLQGSVNSTDAGTMNQEVGGTARVTIPYAPLGLSIAPVGPDPALSVPTDLVAMVGQTVEVPVNIDTAHPDGSGGIMDAVLALTYDPLVFGVSPSDVQLGSLPQGSSGWKLETQVNQQTGQIGIELYSDTPIVNTTSGSLVQISMHALSAAPAGATALDIVPFVDPAGGMRAYQTQLSDAMGAYLLQPVVAALGTEPGAPGQVTIVGQAPLVQASALVPEPVETNTMAVAQQSTGGAVESTSSGVLPAALLEQIFGSLQPGMQLAQPGAILTTESVEQDSHSQATLQGPGQGDWLSEDYLSYLGKTAHKSVRRSELLSGTDGEIDGDELAGLDAYFAREGVGAQ